MSIQTVPTTLAIDQIDLERGAQLRAIVDSDTIEEYAQHYQEGAQFPPVVVFFDGTDYILADGCHRVLAAHEAGLTEIKADIRTGTYRDALLYAAGANGAH